MKISALAILGCMIQMSAIAADGDAQTGSMDRYPNAAALAENSLTSARDHRLAMVAAQTPVPPGRAISQPVRQSPFASAIASAAKKGIVEQSVEAYSDVLIQCQKATSPVLTTPFMRSDSQQAHCYRF